MELTAIQPPIHVNSVTMVHIRVVAGRQAAYHVQGICSLAERGLPVCQNARVYNNILQ